MEESGRPRERVEIRPSLSPLERVIADSELSGTRSLALLQAALRLSRGEEDLARARESLRRGAALEPGELDELAEIADHVGEESYSEEYALMELVQAAAVACSGLSLRNVCSIRLAVAAKQAGHLERARRAYADVFEGLHILRRVFGVTGEPIDRAEASAIDGWASVKHRAERPLDVFDPASDDPAAEWMDLVAWNSDLNSGQGLLAQADATLRLAFRFERWLAGGNRRLEAPVAEMLARCEGVARDQSQANACDEEDGDGPSHGVLTARYLVTVGDALVAVDRWDLAANVFIRVRDHVGSFARHPVALHAAIQEAYCGLMAGDAVGCRARLDAMDIASMEQLAELILTVAATLARYHAVDLLCWRRLSGADPPDARARIARLMQQVSLLAAEGDDRASYLRNLFLAILRRDVGSIVGQIESRSR